MPYFEYKGIRAGKYVEDQIEALNNEEAADKLKQKKIIITKLFKSKKKTKVKKKESISFSFGSGVQTKDILLFTKQLSTMIKAGLRPLESLELLEKQIQEKNMKKIITAIINDLKQGNMLSICFEKHPKTFDNIYINLVRAGEASGKLYSFLEKIVIALDKREKIKAKIKGALMYPVILFTVAIAVTTIMLIKVIPAFEKMYDNFEGTELPLPTQIVISISEFVRSPSQGGVVLILLILFVFVYRYLIKINYKIRKTWHIFIFKIPVFGILIKKSMIARVALVLGNLRSAGVEIVETIDIAKSVTTNIVVVEALENVKKGVFSGEALGKSVEKEKIFPATFHQLITVGDETGNLDEMLNSLAIYYEEEFDDSVGNLSTMIEPIMIVFMGVLIGGLVISMYLPMIEAMEHI